MGAAVVTDFPAAATTDTQARLVPISDLHQWDKNPRTITAARMADLKRALEADPGMLWLRPLIARKDGTVLMGNQRLQAALELGWDALPVIQVDAESETEVLRALRDNQPYGEWEADGLAEILAGLGPIDLSLTGFDSGDLERALAAGNYGQLGDREEPAVPPPPADAITQLGDVIELGRHRLICGDCTDPDVWIEVMGGDVAAITFTSPPYLGVRDYAGDLDLEPGHLARFIPEAAKFSEIICVNLGLLRHDNAIVPYWDVYLDAAAKAGLKLLSWNVWDRGQPWSVAQNTAMFPLEHEWVLVFGEQRKDLRRMVKNKTPGVRTGITNRQPDGSLKRPKRDKIVRDYRALGTVFRSPPHIAGGDIGHPAMFPPALPTAYLQACTDRDEFVVDPFAGAGTTLIAAERIGRRCVLIELDPRYCDVIRDRYERELAR